VDKPSGLTSNAVLNRLKRVLGVKKAGHTGTLDPFATGVLPVCIGGATRIIPFLEESRKEYEAELVLGTETDTLDPTGRVVREMPVGELDEQDVREVLAAMEGVQEQLPPLYSALKVGGRRMYELARKGVEVERKPRRVEIERLELLGCEPPVVRFFVRCSRGTYVRSLAADIARALGTCGHLRALRRLRSGGFDIARAQTLEEIERDGPRLISVEEALSHLPKVEVPRSAGELIRKGRQITLSMVEGVALPDVEEGGLVAVLCGGRLICVAEAAVPLSQAARSAGQEGVVLRLRRVLA